MGLENHSEYEGGGVMPNTVFPKGADALTASDKLRLQSITGQEEDSRAPVDPWFWQGGVYDPRERAEVDNDRRRRIAEERRLSQDETRRYRESPY